MTETTVPRLEIANVSDVPRDGRWYEILPDKPSKTRYVRWNLNNQEWNIIWQDTKH